MKRVLHMHELRTASYELCDSKTAKDQTPRIKDHKKKTSESVVAVRIRLADALKLTKEGRTTQIALCIETDKMEKETDGRTGSRRDGRTNRGSRTNRQSDGQAGEQIVI